MNVAEAFAERIPGVSPGVYSDADFRAIAEIAYESAGIVLPQGKAMLVYSRIAPLVRKAGCGTFANYIARIRSDGEEQARVVAALTTNHTFFYRESHHFEHFAQQVRPGLVRRLHAGEPVRLWSAGCSSGEETWSLVMTLLGSDRAEGTRLAGKDLRVLASDIAPHALAKATAATYPAKEIEQVPEHLRKPWTAESGGSVRIGDTARSIVRFRSLNLQGAWPISRQFDVIFCRNVMIYFDTPTKERLVARFADALLPDGHLYIGHSERVTGPAARVLQPVGPTIYRKCAA
jgi:chemotaxis protein methyltransferase CheR